MKYIDLSKVNDTDKQLEVTSNIIDYPQQNVIESLSPIVLSLLGFNSLAELDTTKVYVISGCDFTYVDTTITSISSGYVLIYSTYSSSTDKKWIIVEVTGSVIQTGISGYVVNLNTPTSPSLNPITYSGGTQDNIYYSLNISFVGTGGTSVNNIINSLNVNSSYVEAILSGTGTLNYDIKQTYNINYNISSALTLTLNFQNQNNPDYKQRTSYILVTATSSSPFSLLNNTSGFNVIKSNKYSTSFNVTPTSPLIIEITTLYYPSLSQYTIIIN